MRLLVEVGDRSGHRSTVATAGFELEGDPRSPEVVPGSSGAVGRTGIGMASTGWIGSSRTIDMMPPLLGLPATLRNQIASGELD